jgi:hypothetical protein
MLRVISTSPGVRSPKTVKSKKEQRICIPGRGEHRDQSGAHPPRLCDPRLKARKAIEQQTDDLDRKVLRLARYDARSEGS